MQTHTVSFEATGQAATQTSDEFFAGLVPKETLFVDFRKMFKGEESALHTLLKSNERKTEFYQQNPEVYLKHTNGAAKLYAELDNFLLLNRHDLETLEKERDLVTLCRILSLLVSIDRANRYLHYIVKSVVESQIPKFKMEDVPTILSPVKDSFPIMFSRDVAIYGYDSVEVRERYFGGSGYLQDALKPMYPELINADRGQLLTDLRGVAEKKRLLRSARSCLALKYGVIVDAINEMLENDNTNDFIRSMSSGLGDYLLHKIASHVTGAGIEDYDGQLRKLRSAGEVNSGSPTSKEIREKVALFEERNKESLEVVFSIAMYVIL